jgi:hypothetical protein
LTYVQKVDLLQQLLFVMFELSHLVRALGVLAILVQEVTVWMVDGKNVEMSVQLYVSIWVAKSALNATRVCDNPTYDGHLLRYAETTTPSQHSETFSPQPIPLFLSPLPFQPSSLAQSLFAAQASTLSDVLFGLHHPFSLLARSYYRSTFGSVISSRRKSFQPSLPFTLQPQA